MSEYMQDMVSLLWIISPYLILGATLITIAIVMERKGDK